MLITKTTYGFVTQVFDSETKECIGQEFVSGDQIDFEDEDCESIYDDVVTDELWYPYNMESPKKSEV
jgi:hypothetical protein